MTSPETFACVATHLPTCLTDIVRGYFESSIRYTYEIAKAGEYEVCLLETDIDDCFYGACIGGHLAIAELLIARGANRFIYGVHHACEGGHLLVIKMLIKHMDNWGYHGWNWGFTLACAGGHLAIVELMIDHGADDWNEGLSKACSNGDRAIAKLMVAHGANYCYSCDKSMAEHAA